MIQRLLKLKGPHRVIAAVDFANSSLFLFGFFLGITRALNPRNLLCGPLLVGPKTAVLQHVFDIGNYKMTDRRVQGWLELQGYILYSYNTKL